MQSNERLHTIPRWPGYHKYNSLFITSNPKYQCWYILFRLVPEVQPWGWQSLPMMISVCQQHYYSKGPRQPTFPSSLLAARAPQEEPPLTTCPALVLAWPRLWSWINPKTEARWLQQVENKPLKIQTGWTRILLFPMITKKHVCNWIWFVSPNL